MKQIDELNKVSQLCLLSCVMPANKLKLNNIEHVGVITHKCGLVLDSESKHEGLCKCPCGFEFKGYTKTEVKYS